MTVTSGPTLATNFRRHYRVELYDSLKTLLGEEEKPSQQSPWSDLWPSGKWTAEHDEALEFHTGTNRSQSVVLAVAQGPKTVEEINADIPPHDLDWTQVIVADVVERGWIQTTASSQSVRYELSVRGQKMLEALEAIPRALKDAAWRRTWMPDTPI